MNPEPVRMGYVGCGFLAQNAHLPNFASLPGCKLIALAEIRPQLARLVASRYGIPTVYADHLALAADPNIGPASVRPNSAILRGCPRKRSATDSMACS